MRTTEKAASLLVENSKEQGVALRRVAWKKTIKKLGKNFRHLLNEANKNFGVSSAKL